MAKNNDKPTPEPVATLFATSEGDQQSCFDFAGLLALLGKYRGTKSEYDVTQALTLTTFEKAYRC